MNGCCGKEANLEWQGPTIKSYNIDDNSSPMSRAGTCPKDNDVVDLIAFIMLMEYLMAALDAYWISGSNYQMYRGPRH
ncbi:hypothetical protein BGZ93_009516 [Podila epicladia]|nr:hypothetical protein BGZ93_009516 [Podila epicladia]